MEPLTSLRWSYLLPILNPETIQPASPNLIRVFVLVKPTTYHRCRRKSPVLPTQPCMTCSVPSLPSPPPSLPLAHSAPGTRASLLFLQHIRHGPASGTLHWLFPRPRTLFSHHPELCFLLPDYNLGRSWTNWLLVFYFPRAS